MVQSPIFGPCDESPKRYKYKKVFGDFYGRVEAVFVEGSAHFSIYFRREIHLCQLSELMTATNAATNDKYNKCPHGVRKLRKIHFREIY